MFVHVNTLLYTYLHTYKDVYYTNTQALGCIINGLMGAQDQFAHSDTLTMISRNIDSFPWDVYKKTTDWFSQMLLKLFDIL